MRTLKARFLGLCVLMVLLAAFLAPPVAKALCPILKIQCTDGSTRHCVSTGHAGTNCFYSESCVSGC